MRSVLSTFRSRVALLLAAAVLAPQASAAAQLGSWQEQVAPDLGATETLKLRSASGVVSTFSNPSVYVGPYSAFLTSDPTKTTFTVYCVDFLNSISVGKVWTANVTRLATGALATTRLGLSGAANGLLRYKKAAWLATQFSLVQTRAAWTGIHEAIWALTNPGNGQVKTANGLYWFNQVNAAFVAGTPANLDWANWSVVTDVRATGTTGGVQEFLVHQTQVAPEPESYLLLATGLLALWACGRRRRGRLV